MKKHFIYILISVLVCGIILFFTSQTAPANKKGITYNRQFQRIDISTVNEAEKPYSILMDSSYRFVSTTVEEDHTLPVEEDNFASEYSFKGNLIDKNQTCSINVKITVRLFPNGDAFLIVRTFSEDPILKPFNYSLLLPGIHFSTSEIWSLNYHGGSKPSEMITMDASMDSYAGKDGINLLPATLNYLETLQGPNNITLGLLMGPLGIFKEKDLNLVELLSQKQQPLLELSKRKPIKVNFSFQLNPYNRSENWFFISKKRLLNYQDEKTLQNMLSADFNMKKKISFDGIYHIATASSYLGASDVSYDYYYNYAMWEGRRFMDLSKEKPSERFFYDMYLNSLYTTIKSSKYGYWISNVKSKYLWDSYEIPEGYVDTRYCTDAGFFLLKVYTEDKIKSAINAGQKFGDYLIEKFEASDGIKIGKTGFFFYDYYQPGQKKITHASLNHILSELNYLFEIYQSTHNEKYLGLAESILEGIRQTQDLWIRKEGEWRFRDDLWYAVYPVPTGLVFKSLDYTKTLTYEDLLKTQKNYRIIYNKEEPVIQKLILSKRSFLLKEGFQLKE